MTCFFVFAADRVLAQNPASVGFQNKTEINVIVQGYTIVNGNKRAGPALQLKKTKGKAFESNVPGGIRYYTVIDANNFRVLLRDHPVPIQNLNTPLDIVPALGNPNRVMIVATPAP
jgi:hypothetical protein